MFIISGITHASWEFISIGVPDGIDAIGFYSCECPSGYKQSQSEAGQKYFPSHICIFYISQHNTGNSSIQYLLLELLTPNLQGHLIICYSKYLLFCDNPI